MMPRVVIIHPALLSYRLDFFDRLSRYYDGEVWVYYSTSDMGALSCNDAVPNWAEPVGPIRTIAAGVDWQQGAIGVPFSRDDIVVISGAPRCVSNLVLLLRARLKGATTIWWGHYRSASSKPLRMALRMALARSAHALLFYTDAEVDEYRTKTKRRDRRPIHALNNGINSDPIRRRRAAYDPTTRDRALLMIGRLTDKAGLNIAIEALAQPAAAGIDLHIIGDGIEGPSLRAFAEERGLSNRIHWHGGTTSEDQIAAVANRCRAFIYPGEVGLSLIHAMAYGLPVVLHDDPLVQMPEYAAFEDGVTGCSFPRGDVEALAKTLGRMIVDFGRLSTFSTEALHRTERNYTTRSMARRMLALFEELEAGR